MTDEQRDWPKQTLRNERRSPLQLLAAGERARRDFANVLGDTLDWTPAFCEDLEAALVSAHGENWLQELGLGKYAS